MNALQLEKELQAVYKKYFPKSKISIDGRSNFYRSFWIKLYLAGDLSECINGYWDNDMFYISLQIDKDGRDELPDNFRECLPEEVTLSAHGKSYHIKPENKYMAYGRTTLKFRKSTGTPEKIIKNFEVFVSRLRVQVLDDLANDKIHQNHLDLVQEKLRFKLTKECN